MPLTFNVEEATAAIAKADKRLAKVIRQSGPCRLDPEKLPSVFHGLLKAIVYQQLSGKAAATIFARVVAIQAHGRRPTPEEILATPDETLRAAGLSRNKVLAVKDLAQKSVDGIVPPLVKLRRLDDEEIIERLTAVRGIGTWTVEMLLMFNLGRPDVLPVADLGIRKGFQLTYGGEELPKPERIRAQAEAWRPYRTVGSWYLWRAVDLAKPRTE